MDEKKTEFDCKEKKRTIIIIINADVDCAVDDDDDGQF